VDGSTGSTSYNVYRGTSSGGESGTALATGITTTNYTDSAVTNGVTYYYEVRGVSGGGTGNPSNEANATPDPLAPTDLTATAGNTRIALSWTPSLAPLAIASIAARVQNLKVQPRSQPVLPLQRTAIQV